MLREIPETLRKDPRASNYRPSHWKRERKRDRKIHNTRSRARCQPGTSTPKHSSTEGSGSEEESHSLSTAAASRSRSSHGRGNNRKSTRGTEQSRTGRDNKQTSPEDRKATRLHSCLHPRDSQPRTSGSEMPQLETPRYSSSLYGAVGIHTPASSSTCTRSRPWV